MTRAASPTTVAFWIALWTALRPYLAFVSGAAAMVGLAFAETTRARTLAAFVPLFVAYGFGQALTDCFQVDTDAISAPYRPLVRGILGRGQLLAVSLGGLAAAALALVWLNPRVLIVAAIAVAGLVLYTPLKRTWWGGPPWNAGVVALVPVIARMAQGGTVLDAWGGARGHAFAAAVAAVFLGYADFVVTGYLKDVSADRSTGYRTFPVAFGWAATARYGDALAMGSAAAAAAVLWAVRAGGAAWALLAAAAVVAVRAHAWVHRVTEERAAHRPIAGVVRAVLLTCSAMTIGVRPAWLPWLVPYHALFELALQRRPEPTQV